MPSPEGGGDPGVVAGELRELAVAHTVAAAVPGGADGQEVAADTSAATTVVPIPV